MSLSGRICLILFALMLTIGLVIERGRPIAIQPATHLPVSANTGSAEAARL